MKTYGKFALAFGLFVLFRHVAFAQLPALSIDPVETELQGVTIFGNQSPVAVTGAPYSAIEESLYSQGQPDGTYEDRSLVTTHIYRDWRGRTRAERYVTSYLPGAGESKLRSIFITDPVAGVLYRLESENHTATRGPWNANMQVPSADANAAGQVRSSGGQPVSPPITMRQALAASSARYEFYLTVLAIFGTLALVLTASGLYGLMTYSVQNRRKELAIRTAFGATPVEVQWMVVRQALRLTVYGVLAGIPLAVALTTITVSSVFGVQTWDPMMLAIVTLLLCVVSLFAAYVPSVRASQVDPVAALRTE